ncbi:MAG: VanW family protein [Candidatus Levybacteria bacterium]|nr:VanW family protein [Candidatus Levybacteria bacterium]
MIGSLIDKKNLKKTLKVLFWFSAGGMLGLFLFVGFTFIIFRKVNSNLVYPGITVGNIDLSGKTEQQVKDLFSQKNTQINNTQFTFLDDMNIATVSAKDLNYGYNGDLIAQQAISIGRGDNFFSNISLVTQAYIGSLKLEPSYHYSEEKLIEILSPFIKSINKDPTDALFTFENGKVTTFRVSSDGQMIDIDAIKKSLDSQFTTLLLSTKSPKNAPKNISIRIPIKIIKPKITTDKINNLGIKELIGTGTSLFSHSIQSRIFNITLAASKINGVLIAPGEEFSFDKALGDVSAFTGYKQAYIIQGGKTILGDGGGVCQVSTTFFRSILDAGLPITERNAHSYRVGYYELDSPPGLDATIYVPSVDLKFKNDTGNYVLIQTLVDENLQQLSIFLYGTKDGRTVEISKPVITNIIPPPEDRYQDDPNLPKGTVKQIDFKAEGSRVSFTRLVHKNGKEIISDKFISNYSPWQAVFLRGTKEN